MGPLPPRAELEASELVFAGEVIAKRDVNVTEAGYPEAYGHSFRVSRAWNGVGSDTVEVHSSSAATSLESEAVGTSSDFGKVRKKCVGAAFS